MNVLCVVLGHKPGRTIEGTLWLTLDAPYHDGIGRAHRNVWSRCERCSKRSVIGRTIDSTHNESKDTPK